MAARKKIDREEFARLDAQGLTHAELADHFGVARSSVIRLRAELGLPSRRAYRATPEQLATWEAALDEGWSRAEVARTFGVPVSTIKHFFPDKHWTQAEHLEHLARIRRLNRELRLAPYAEPAKRDHGDARRVLALPGGLPFNVAA